MKHVLETYTDTKERPFDFKDGAMVFINTLPIQWKIAKDSET